MAFWFLPLIAKAAAVAAKTAAVVGKIGGLAAKPIAMVGKAALGMGGGTASPIASAMAKGVGSAVGGSSPLAALPGMAGQMAAGVGNAVGGVQAAAAPSLMQGALAKGGAMLGKGLGIDNMMKDPIGAAKSLGALNKQNQPQGSPNADTAVFGSPQMSQPGIASPLALGGNPNIGQELSPELLAKIRERMMAGAY